MTFTFAINLLTVNKISQEKSHKPYFQMLAAAPRLPNRTTQAEKAPGRNQALFPEEVWWEKLDLNQRRHSQRIYSPPHLTGLWHSPECGARSETRTHKPEAGTRSLVWRVFRFRHSCIWRALQDSNPGHWD